MVRNGYLPDREIQTGIGPVTVQIPKVRAEAGKPVTFCSALVPPYVRNTHSLEPALPWLYLKGVSTGEMSAALVIIGMNERGEKYFLAIEDSVRESTQSWREVLLKLKSHGMNVSRLAFGDGAMGFWAALKEVYPKTRHQRCWMHKTMNVPNCLPKWLQPKAKQAPHELSQTNTREDAEKTFDLFLATYEPKYPKATLCLQKYREELMAFYDFPAQHWQGGVEEMDHAHPELESGTQPVYDRLRRPADQLCLTQAVTQKYLKSRELI